MGCIEFGEKKDEYQFGGMIKDTGRQGYAFRQGLLNWLFLSKSDVIYPKKRAIEQAIL